MKQVGISRGYQSEYLQSSILFVGLDRCVGAEKRKKKKKEICASVSSARLYGEVGARWRGGEGGARKVESLAKDVEKERERGGDWCEKKNNTLHLHLPVHIFFFVYSQLSYHLPASFTCSGIPNEEKKRKVSTGFFYLLFHFNLTRWE